MTSEHGSNGTGYRIQSGPPEDADYTPYGTVREAMLCHDAEVGIAGAADTGKTLGMLHKLHLVACKYPGASIVIVRKQLTDTYGTVLQTFQKKVLHDGAPVTVYGGGKPQWFDYSNGSRIWVAGLDKSSKILSAEFDVLYANQAEELSLPDWEMLTTRTTGRAGNVVYPQCILDCNPGPPTHWIRSRSRDGTLTLFNSTHRDNPELYDPITGEMTPGGEQRLGRLRNLSGSRLMRLYHGLWAAPEGAIYDVFDEEKHKVAAFPIPPLWPRAVGIDPLGAYIAAVWAALDPTTGILNVYREYYGPFGETTPGHVAKMLELSKGETIFAWYGGAPSERQQRADFQGAGIPLLRPGVGDLWVGIDRIYQLLKEFAMVIHDSCPQLLSEIGDYRRTMKNGVVTENIENKDAFHAVDSLRYLVTGLTEPEDGVEWVYQPARIGRQW